MDFIFSIPKLRVYESVNLKSGRKEWRWNIKVNADIVAQSSEGYANRSECLENIRKIEGHIKSLRENDMIK